MWDDEYVSDESEPDLKNIQLAIQIGIIGLVIQLSTYFGWVFLSFLEYEVSMLVSMLLVYRSTLYNLTFFIGAIFTSVGFVGLFLLKRSKMGLVFVLCTLITSYGFMLYTRLLLFLDLFEIGIYSTSSVILGYIVALVTGITLLTIRERVDNTQIFYVVVFFTFTSSLLSAGIFYLLFGPSVEITSGFVYLFSQFPTLLIVTLNTLARIQFFMSERKLGIYEQNQFEDTPFPE